MSRRSEFQVRCGKIGIVFVAMASTLLLNAIADGGGRRGKSFDLSWNTVDGGGGTCSSGDFELSGTIGQHDAAGPLIGGDFTMTGGFWPGTRADAAVPCEGDANGDGTVDPLDSGYVLARLRMSRGHGRLKLRCRGPERRRRR